jgi:5'(3')-deoxyribonucleotidase
MRHNIGIDLDGVVCDIYMDAFKILKKMYPTKVTSDKWAGDWQKEYELTEEQVCNIFISAAKDGFFRTAKIYPEAKDTLRKLSKMYNIFFVSWRNYIPNAREDTLYWLDSNHIPYEKLVLTNNKCKAAVNEKFVFFLDDNIQQCNRIAKTQTPSFLFLRPWNSMEGTDALVKGIKSWKEVEQLLNFLPFTANY